MIFKSIIIFYFTVTILCILFFILGYIKFVKIEEKVYCSIDFDKSNEEPKQQEEEYSEDEISNKQFRLDFICIILLICLPLVHLFTLLKAFDIYKNQDLSKWL